MMSHKIKKSSVANDVENGQGDHSSGSPRIPVNKTYKLYIGGNFPRTESGRYTAVVLKDGTTVNVCQSSRKDFRDAVVAARKAQSGWSARSAYNRSQILYRIAEVMEGRKIQFISNLEASGHTLEVATAEVEKSIDCIIYYAGWCDKYVQIYSCVNPVASSHFNFSIPEPTGVVGLLAGAEQSLSGMIGHLLPIICGANTTVVLVPAELATSAIDFAEVLATSDVPAGVVNILSGDTTELIPHFGSHLDVNALIYAGEQNDEFKYLQELASEHILRLVDRRSSALQEIGPYQILDTQEIKTTWHPIGT
jgi:acyl-CoA reductase-like NAD-dependent aldehyde dehydrogenase